MTKFWFCVAMAAVVLVCAAFGADDPLFTGFCFGVCLVSATICLVARR